MRRGRGKRGRSSGEVVVIILAIFIAVAVLFAVVVPPLLPLLWVFFEIRDRGLEKPTDARAFALTREQWDELEHARGELAAAGGEGGKKSKKTKQLEETVAELEQQPVERWKAWADAVENIWGNRVGLAAGFACFALVLLTRATPMNAVYGAVRTDVFAGCNKLVDKPSFVGISLMVLPLLAWLIGAFVGWSMGEKKATRILAQPEPAGAEQPGARAELADEGARDALFEPLGGTAVGLSLAFVTSGLSVALVVLAVVGRI